MATSSLTLAFSFWSQNLTYSLALDSVQTPPLLEHSVSFPVNYALAKVFQERAREWKRGYSEFSLGSGVHSELCSCGWWCDHISCALDPFGIFSSQCRVRERKLKMSIELLLSDEPFVQAHRRQKEGASDNSTSPTSSSSSTLKIVDVTDDFEKEQEEKGKEISQASSPEKIVCVDDEDEDEKATMVTTTATHSGRNKRKTSPEPNNNKQTNSLSESNKKKSNSFDSALVLYNPNRTSQALVPSKANSIARPAASTSSSHMFSSSLPSSSSASLFSPFLYSPFLMPPPPPMLPPRSDKSVDSALANYPFLGLPLMPMMGGGQANSVLANQSSAASMMATPEQQQQFLAAAASLYFYQQHQFAQYANAWAQTAAASSSSSTAVQRGRIPLTPTHTNFGPGSGHHSVLSAAISAAAAAAAVGLSPTGLQTSPTAGTTVNGLEHHHNGTMGSAANGSGSRHASMLNGNQSAAAVAAAAAAAASSNGGYIVNSLVRAEPGVQDLNQYLQTHSGNGGHLSYEHLCEFALGIFMNTLKWVKNIPYFPDLSLADQTTMLRFAWSDLFILGASQCSLPVNSMTASVQIS